MRISRSTYFDNAVAGATGEPLVARIDVQAAHPAEMAADHAVQLPGRVPLRLRHGQHRLLLDHRELLMSGRRGALAAEDAHRRSAGRAAARRLTARRGQQFVKARRLGLHVQHRARRLACA